jgi:hypothetical protein
VASVLAAFARPPVELIALRPLLGIALFGSAGTLIYHQQLTQAGGQGLPPEAVATLGGALAVA